MTLAQLEERLTALEKVVEQLQTRVNGEFKPDSSSRAEQRRGTEEDLIPGTEYDLVVTVPPKESFRIQGRIISIQTPPAELGLSAEEWALFGSENEDE
jgi:hypothetical protein